MIDDEKQSFIDSYRAALERQRDLDLQNIEIARKNDYASIMSGANERGMMYSNFPERSKIQYNANTYLPSVAKAQTTYQTGLDKLRNDVVTYKNQLSELNEAISDLNKSNYVFPVPGAMSIGDNYYYRDTGGGTQFRTPNNEPMRFGHAIDDMGYYDADDILQYGKAYLTADEFKRLKNAYDSAPEGMTLAPNWGDNYKEGYYDWIDASDNNLINSLGLKFTQI